MSRLTMRRQLALDSSCASVAGDSHLATVVLAAAFSVELAAAASFGVAVVVVEEDVVVVAADVAALFEETVASRAVSDNAVDVGKEERTAYCC